ncbi:MAG TPA: periplasmic heavy metal sensor [Candidatus Sulfotelmatobacter sp.]|nr:periplasmic heavy metal sensor [Candidatus Sulfotelmatobacter sp.]
MRRIGRWWALAASALLLGAWGVGLAWAQQPQPPGSRTPCTPRQGLLTPDDRAAMGQIFMNRIKATLGLSDQTAADIQTILKNGRPSQQDFQTLCLARVNLRNLLKQADSDPGAVQAASDNVASLTKAMTDRRLATQLAIRSKLTPDQWAQWQQLRRHGRGGWRGGPGGFTS